MKKQDDDEVFLSNSLQIVTIDDEEEKEKANFGSIDIRENKNYMKGKANKKEDERKKKIRQLKAKEENLVEKKRSWKRKERRHLQETKEKNGS